MEKVLVKIGHVGKSSTKFISLREWKKDIDFIQSCFEISYKRAHKVVNFLRKQFNESTSCYIEVNLNYRQLARYTAKRQVEGLNQYWKYPHVLEHIEDYEETNHNVPIELRPGKRDITTFLCE